MPKDFLTPFTHDDYEVIKRDVPYRGVFRIARYNLRFRLFDGGWSKAMKREVMERKSAVAILPYDPILDQVVLIEQFRVGALANPKSPWLIEIVAGVLEKNESVESVAKREAIEEANCEILDIYPVSEYFVSPGGCNEYITIYCGRIDASNAGGVFGLVKENENIRAFALPADEAFIYVQEGLIKTSPAVVSLQWLQLNKEWLRQLWQSKTIDPPPKQK